MKPCKFCGRQTKNKVFCSSSCSGKWATTTPEGRAKFYTKERGRKISVAKFKMHKEHPEYAQRLRMRQLHDNCMKNPTTRAKVSKALRDIGWKPPVRGGNGHGPTEAEKILLSLFAEAVNNYPVRTGEKVGSGYPTRYKVDVAFPQYKLAVEVDGASHNNPGQRSKDAKKQMFLEGLGWRVLRVTNQMVKEKTEAVGLAIRYLIYMSSGILLTESTDS